MARGSDLENRDAHWRDLALAGGAAAAVTMLLVVSVLAIWTMARAPAGAPALTAQDTATPTPRALSFRLAQPTEVVLVRRPRQRLPAPAALEIAAEATATPAPELPAPSEGGEAPPPVWAPCSRRRRPPAFRPWPSGSWSATDDLLRSDGAGGLAEPWLALAAVPSAAFAVEADIRLVGLIENVCGQSFGLTGGSPSAQQWYGGGIHFPCENAPREARLTDVSVWQDGYNGDPVIAQALYDPGDGWHTYRFEQRGDRIRLIVDGIGIAGGMLAAPLDPATTDGQAGIWTQGAAIEIRRIAVYALPAS